jgi:hypothetical protein
MRTFPDSGGFIWSSRSASTLHPSRAGLVLSAASLFFLAILGPLARAEQVRFAAVPDPKLEARLRDAPWGNGKRKQKLVDLFTEAGCAEHLSQEKVKGSSHPNIVCSLPGETQDTILVGAHYDAVVASYGVADNWAGASLLPALFESLKASPRKHKFVFVGFTDEEAGLIGSKFYARQLSEQDRAGIHAMVNLDTLGLAPATVWLSQADPTLAAALTNVANALKMPLSGTNVDEVGNTDSSSFKKVGIPSITIHSLTQETFPFLHTSQDNIDKIQWDEYFRTYRLVATYLAYLDIAMKPEVTTPGEPAR